MTGCCTGAALAADLGDGGDAAADLLQTQRQQVHPVHKDGALHAKQLVKTP